MPDVLTVVEKTVFLKSIEMLSSIPTEALARLAVKADEAHCEPGEVLFREGDADRGSFLVIRGVVELRKSEAQVRTIRERMAFGDLNLDAELPHEFTAVALERTHLLNIRSADVLDALLDFPEFGLALVRAQELRVQKLTRRVIELEARLEQRDASLRAAGVTLPDSAAPDDPAAAPPT